MVVKTVKNVPNTFWIVSNTVTLIGLSFFLFCEFQESEMGKWLLHAWNKSTRIQGATYEPIFPLLSCPVCVWIGLWRKIASGTSIFVPQVIKKKEGKEIIITLRKKEGFPGDSDDKESACSAGDLGSIPGSGRSPGGGHGNPLQYSCLENPMDRGDSWATVHGVTKSQTQLCDFHQEIKSRNIHCPK